PERAPAVALAGGDVGVGRLFCGVSARREPAFSAYGASDRARLRRPWAARVFELRQLPRTFAERTGAQAARRVIVRSLPQGRCARDLARARDGAGTASR